jgi:tetratricopeptide (TPR) repeat protein
MRRYVVVLVVLGGAFAIGAGLFTAYATDREYARYITAGDEAVAANQSFRALESYSGAITLRPDSMLAHLKRGRAYGERGELEAAARDLRHAAALDPTATLPLELLGDTYLSMHRNERAAERFQAYLTLDDRSAGVWYKLGLALYRGGQAREATRPLERAVGLDPTLSEAHLLLGLCLRDTGENAAARTALERAVRLAPGLTAPREALAAVYRALGDNAHAIDQLDALAALDPTAPDRWVALGMAYARARRHESAVLTLSRAVERFPDAPQVYGALGRVWLDAAELQHDEISLKKALEALTTAASHADVTSAMLTDLGRAWMMAGDATAAERALRQATSRLPVEPDAYLRLAAVIARDRLQEARDALLRYAALVGDTRPMVSVAFDIASYSLRLGQPELALKWIHRAVDESGDTPALAALRGRALRESGLPR